MVSQSFSFSSPGTPSSAAPVGGPVLSIRRVRVAAPFDNQAFVYRTGNLSYERDPYAGFLVPPDESLAEPLRNYLRASGLFRIVVEPGSVVQPSVVAEVSVGQLYGDFRDRSHPVAVLEIHFTFIHMEQGAPRKVLFEKSYAKRVPLSARTASALMTGWNTALQEIVRDVITDLKQTPALAK
ncbi:MAG: ABC-type transport auxiliary lipoprotein family protein [Limisphaerales bacterium]